MGSFPWRFKKAAYALMNLCACGVGKHHRISNYSVFRSLSTPSRLLQTMMYICICRAVPCHAVPLGCPCPCPSVCDAHRFDRKKHGLSRQSRTKPGETVEPWAWWWSVLAKDHRPCWRRASSSGGWKSCSTYINIANGDTATHFDCLG